MKSSDFKYDYKIYSSIKEVSKTIWNKMARTRKSPFLEWEWLYVLEESGSICRATGWSPQHIIIYKNSQIISAAPFYLKYHSDGEFIYDYMWQDAANQLDIRYFPKLVGMIPATPSIAYDFLLMPGLEAEEDDIYKFILDTMKAMAEAEHIQSIQINFPVEKLKNQLEKYEYQIWLNQLFAWENPGHSDFDSYLAGFRKNQRRNIKREVQSTSDQGYSIQVRTGDQIDSVLAKKMNLMYTLTNNKFGMWAARFLEGDFFNLAARHFAHRLVIFEAIGPDGDTCGMSMLVRKNDVIVGRYAGATHYVKNLHFNFCYYEPIRYAITEGIRYFDPGAGSSHKIRRGFLAVPACSAHLFLNPTMKLVFEKNIQMINRRILGYIQELNKTSPLKQHEN